MSHSLIEERHLDTELAYLTHSDGSGETDPKDIAYYIAQFEQFIRTPEGVETWYALAIHNAVVVIRPNCWNEDCIGTVLYSCEGFRFFYGTTDPIPEHFPEVLLLKRTQTFDAQEAFETVAWKGGNPAEILPKIRARAERLMR